MTKNIEVIAFDVEIPYIGCSTYYVMYNSLVITEDEVRHLIERHTYDTDERVVCLTEEQYKFLTATEGV